MLPFSKLRQYVSKGTKKTKKEFRSKLEKNEQIKQYKTKGKLDIEKIYEKFYNYVHTIITNNAKGNLKEEDKEEIISDTFLILWKNSQKLDENKAIKPYISGITKNLIKEKARKRKIHLDITEYENKIETEETIDIIVEQREKISIIKENIEKLSKQEKEIFILYYYKSMKIKQIAEHLGTTEFTIKQKLYRIRKRIKKLIEKEGGYRYEK